MGIYNEALPERDRKPACVLACPTSARLFGDIHDPESVVSKAIKERGGYQLMPEWDTKPANHYLPRTPVTSCSSGGSCSCKSNDNRDASPEAQLERGELNLAAMAART